MTKKTLIALAVSTAVTAPAAQAAEFRIGEDTTINVGGTIEPVYQSVKDDSGESRSEFADNDSTLQFDGEHAWTGSTTGFFHIEYEWSGADETTDGGVNSLDSAYIGMKGDLGMIRAGTSDSLYEDNVAELVDEFENGTLTEEEDGGEGNQIRYVSPGFGGFSVGLEAKIEGDGEGNIENDGADFGDGGTGLSFVARYDAENWGVVAGADDRGGSPVDVDNDGDTDEYDDETTAGVGGYFNVHAFSLSARFASESNRGNNNDIEYTGAMGGYDYGAGNVYVGVQDVSPDQGDSFTEVAAIVKHGLYDNLDVFVNVARYDRPNDAGDLAEVGAIYGF